MNNDTLEEIIEVYSEILSDAHISLKKADVELYPELVLILGQISEHLPNHRIKLMDYKFGRFRITFFDDVVIPDVLKIAKNVWFYL